METGIAIGLFLNSRHSKNLSPQTIRWYREILDFFAQKYPILPTAPEDIEEFLADCQAGDERRHGYYRAIKCFYRFLHKRLNIPNPVELVEAPRRKSKKPKFLTPIEINKLLSSPLKPKIKTAILFLVDTGARLGETASVNITDIEETAYGFIIIIKGKTGERIVPISYETYHALMINLPFGWTRDWLGRLISCAFKDAEIKGSSITLRHSFGTLWQGDELILQQIMGHKSLATTRIYRHLRTRILSEQHNQYSPLRMVMATSRNML